MERCQKAHTFSVEKKLKKKTSKKELVNSICHEYCLKRKQFHPTSPSPNLFTNRLEIRMKVYYNDLYKSLNL